MPSFLGTTILQEVWPLAVWHVLKKSFTEAEYDTKFGINSKAAYFFLQELTQTLTKMVSDGVMYETIDRRIEVLEREASARVLSMLIKF